MASEITDQTYSVYYCPNPYADKNARQWIWLTSVEGYANALTACRLLRKRKLTPRAIRVDPCALLTPPPRHDDVPSEHVLTLLD